MWVTGIGSGQLADWMRENNVLSTGEVRKVLATGGECLQDPHQILQTDLHTFLLRIVERIWFKIPVPLIMNLVILVTLTLDDLLMLLGGNRCWSLFGPKGLK